MLHNKYIWEGKYRAAILEPNPIKLAERIETAREQINRRLEYLRVNFGPMDGEELSAMQEALSELRVLERIEVRRRA